MRDMNLAEIRQKERRSWTKVLQDKFNKYCNEAAVQGTLKTYPETGTWVFSRTDNGRSSQVLVAGRSSNTSQSLLLSRDKMLPNAQEKIVRVMGTLRKLWASLDEARKLGDSQMLSLSDTLSLTEKTVVLSGQASIGVRYAKDRPLCFRPNRNHFREMLSSSMRRFPIQNYYTRWLHLQFAQK